jgi:hypothetical protein
MDSEKINISRVHGVMLGGKQVLAQVSVGPLLCFAHGQSPEKPFIVCHDRSAIECNALY